MIPRIIHHVYVGGPIPDEMEDFMGTVLLHNPTWKFYLWTSESIPLLGLNYEALLERFKKPVHVSDFVRLVAVQKHGGIYLDSDVEGVRPFDSLCKYDAVAACQDGTGQICPATFGASPDHPWINWQIAHADEYSLPDTPWNVTLMTDAPRDGLTLVPTDTFYPWLWDTPKAERKITDRTLSIHHWKGSWAPWVIRDRT